MQLHLTRFLQLVTVVTLAFSNVAGAADLPDPSLTPGVTDLNISQQNIQLTVCVKGYTKTVRPPAQYTNKLKKRQIRQYGYDDQNPKHYEEDHLIPLSIGGDPRAIGNLWPEDALGQHIAHGVLDVAWVATVIHGSGQSFGQADLLVDTAQ